jgi:gas vesicle protein
MDNQNMDQRTPDTRDSRLVLGILTGTVIGAAIGIWFAPRMTMALRRMDEWVKVVQSGAVEQYRQANARTGDAIENLTQVGQKVRNDAADVVIRGAREVERVATAAKTV